MPVSCLDPNDEKNPEKVVFSSPKVTSVVNNPPAKATIIKDLDISAEGYDLLS